MLLFVLFAVSCNNNESVSRSLTAEDIAFALDVEMFAFRLPREGSNQEFAIEAYTEDKVLDSFKLNEAFKGGDDVIVILERDPYRFTITKEGVTSHDRIFDFGGAELQMWRPYEKGEYMALGECFAVFSTICECSMPPKGNDIGVRLIQLK